MKLKSQMISITNNGEKIGSTQSKSTNSKSPLRSSHPQRLRLGRLAKHQLLHSNN